MKMKIYANRFYVLADYPGTSGFRDWSYKEECVVTGQKAKHRRTYIEREYRVGQGGVWRVNDGHLPEHEPRMSESDALEWLTANPYQSIKRIS